jgi:hypothetical protein
MTRTGAALTGPRRIRLGQDPGGMQPAVSSRPRSIDGGNVVPSILRQAAAGLDGFVHIGKDSLAAPARGFRLQQCGRARVGEPGNVSTKISIGC